MSEATNNGNVVEFPGSSTGTKEGKKCNTDEEDPCERARKTLEDNKGFTIRNLSPDPSIRARQIRDFNKSVLQHNITCPRHTVEPIAIGPTPVP